MLHFAYQISCIENKKEVFFQTLEQFQQTPLEQKAEHVSSIISTFLIPTPNKLHTGIQNTNKFLERITKLAKSEYAGLKALHQVETAVADISHHAKSKELYPFTMSFEHAIHDVAKIASSGKKEAHAVEQCATASSSSASAMPATASVAHIAQEIADVSIVIENTALLTAQEIHDLESACHSLGECSKRIAVKVTTPELQTKVSEALKRHCEKAICEAHDLRYVESEYKKQKFHFITPEKLKSVVSNEKDWEKLVKAFDGGATPAQLGKQASKWHDYQHFMGPVAQINCETGYVKKLHGFHHDYLGNSEKSGLIKFTEKIERPHGFYECYWKYDNIEKKFSTFFPKDWTPSKVMSKIEESLHNLVGEAFWTERSVAVTGKIKEGITIITVFEVENGRLTGKIISSYPTFKKII